MSRDMTKPTKWHVRPAKTQISLGIHPVWSASSLCAQWPQVSVMRTAKTLISLGGCPGWSESSLGAHSLCLFCHVAAHFFYKGNAYCIMILSGARVVYNLQKRPGSRVVSLDVRCLKCHVPTYSPIEMEEVYDLLLADWLITAGDGYDMFKDNIIEHIELSMCALYSVRTSWIW